MSKSDSLFNDSEEARLLGWYLKNRNLGRRKAVQRLARLAGVNYRQFMRVAKFYRELLLIELMLTGKTSIPTLCNFTIEPSSSKRQVKLKAKPIFASVHRRLDKSTITVK